MKEGEIKKKPPFSFTEFLIDWKKMGLLLMEAERKY